LQGQLHIATRLGKIRFQAESLAMEVPQPGGGLWVALLDLATDLGEQGANGSRIPRFNQAGEAIKDRLRSVNGGRLLWSGLGGSRTQINSVHWLSDLGIIYFARPVSGLFGLRFRLCFERGGWQFGYANLSD
jgi:hypothetical protein